MPQFTLIQDIKEILLCSTMPLPFLKGEAMSALPSCKNAYLIIEDGKIHSFGSMNDIPNLRFEKIVSANNGYIFPSWVDSHTHLVFAAWREQEFMDRIEGLSYEEIAEFVQCPIGTVRSRIFRAREAISLWAERRERIKDIASH